MNSLTNSMGKNKTKIYKTFESSALCAQQTHAQTKKQKKANKFVALRTQC